MKGVLKYFNNVMIDDSTTLHLPDELAKEFPGNVSRGIKKAQAKIHAMYNVTENNFPFFAYQIFIRSRRNQTVTYPARVTSIHRANRMVSQAICW
jgi:hypothetical protein